MKIARVWEKIKAIRLSAIASIVKTRVETRIQVAPRASTILEIHSKIGG